MVTFGEFAPPPSVPWVPTKFTADPALRVPAPVKARVVWSPAVLPLLTVIVPGEVNVSAPTVSAIVPPPLAPVRVSEPSVMAWAAVRRSTMPALLSKVSVPPATR